MTWADLLVLGLLISTSTACGIASRDRKRNGRK